MDINLVCIWLGWCLKACTLVGCHQLGENAEEKRKKDYVDCWNLTAAYLSFLLLEAFCFFRVPSSLYLAYSMFMFLTKFYFVFAYQLCMHLYDTVFIPHMHIKTEENGYNLKSFGK